MKISPENYSGIGAGLGALVFFAATYNTPQIYMTLVGAVIGGLIGQGVEKIHAKVNKNQSQTKKGKKGKNNPDAQ